MKKLFCLCISLLLVLSALVSCSADPEVFSWNGLMLTLDSSFTEEKIDEESVAFISYAKMYAVAITYETVESLVDMGYDTDMTVAEYASLSLETDGLDAEIKTADGVIYYSYESSADGVEYTNMTTVHFYGNAFWLVRFACKTEDFAEAEPQFFAWAKTVTYTKMTV